MGSFKKFLLEDENLLKQIYDLLGELTDEEIDDLGFFLYTEFFDLEGPVDVDPTDEIPPCDPEEDEEGVDLTAYDTFDIDDVKEMINALGPEMYEDILDLLSDDDSEEDGSEEDVMDGDMGEGVSRRMKTKNMNRKRRKFMTLSKSKLRRTKVKRKQMARKTMAKRKRYYRANKVKIASYQKSRSAAMKKGKHRSKIRRPA